MLRQTSCLPTSPVFRPNARFSPRLMFKAQVLRRNFSLFNRVPSSRFVRSAAHDGHETISVQRFRIVKPFFSKSRLVGTIAVAGALYGISRYIGIQVEIEEVDAKSKTATRSGGQNSNQDENDGSDDDEEIGDEYDDEALLFLPTGLSRPRRTQFYKGSDPEWQEFRKVATDRPRVQRIREELVSMVRTGCSKSPQFVARVGRIDTTKGNIWLEIKFPDAPPTEYERPGIELTEDLQWRRASRPVEPNHHHRLGKVLFPKEAATSLYQDTKRKAKVSWRELKVYMGLEKQSDAQTAQQLVRRLGADPPLPSPAASTGNTTSNPSSTSPAKDTQQPTAPSPAAPIEGLAKDLGFVLPDSKSLKLDLTQFRQDFRKEFKAYPMIIPRGAFVVMGLVEVYGDRARMTMSVTGAYDPKQGKYVNVRMGMFSLIEHRQTPKGGP